MFYSHEVLTSRKYGVATVWLVATLGQKSTTRKVSRRAILDVDVPKACETIIAPEAPMALRLQSSLLFGVTRVYAQQCGYVLADTQHAQTAMRTLFKVAYGAQIDSEATKARSEQITLQDDPAFVPGFSLASITADLRDLDNLSAGVVRRISDSASLHTTQSQHLLPVGLQLPASSSSVVDAFQIPGSGSREPRLSSLMARDEDDLLLPDIDIGLDADGNFVEFDNALQSPDYGVGGPSLLSEAAQATALSGNLGLTAGQLVADDYLPLVDDGYTLPPPEIGATSRSFGPRDDQADTMADIDTAVAPQRRRPRVPKVIPLDKSIELRNRDLLAMNNEYKNHMTAEWNRIATTTNAVQAKKNADYWLLGRGIASVGDHRALRSIKGPLVEMWTGDSLYLMLTGKDRAAKGTKRGSDDEGSVAGRHVRPRLDDDLPLFHGGDDDIMRDYELEIGREGQTALEDISSAMPWNVSASIRGSSVARSAAGATGVQGSTASSLARRGSRLVSASPLVGRGHLAAIPGGSPLSDPAAFDDLSGPIGDDRFEMYGAGADVDTQTAGQSQWQRAAFDRESTNFLEFIGSAIEVKRAAAQNAGLLMIAEADNIDFEELLPPESNSRTVAAQALLHVLTLGAKHLIRATQKESFAAITLEVR